MTKRLSTAQVQSVSTGKGLFTPDAWKGCLVYLHELRSNPDPINTEQWMQSLGTIKVFLEWALFQTKSRFGKLAHECLLAATQKEMTQELQHELNDVPCIFSFRRHPILVSTASRPAEATSSRLQCSFRWWAHHEQSGMECPHTSQAYVYESHFSFLIRGMYVLGHLAAVLQDVATKDKEEGVTVAAFQARPEWVEFYSKLNHILYVVWAMLAL